ncbi:MAG: ferrochelatase [Thiotrichales bacterium]|nr:MAG: ferrochelatase [Thiotrichales bacterium]
MKTKTGVLLINIGTPKDCDIRSVKTYLREFLSDPRVIDLPNIIRWLLVNLIIVPRRAPKSLKAYKKIWQPCGSPLEIYSDKLKQSLQQSMQDEFIVEIAMRYGKNSIQKALQRLSECGKLIVIPLFPQYSSAATESAIEAMFAALEKKWRSSDVKVITSFYDHPDFVSAYTEVIRKNLPKTPIDMLLFSYHGLPVRHIEKTGCGANCNKVNVCPKVSKENLNCYRAQCYATSEALAQRLGLSLKKYLTTFQSRLGGTKWIEPYTDKILNDLKAQGVKNIAIVCPAFVTDCLETLEEIGIRLRKKWEDLGGEEFTLIPCLNINPRWIKTLKNIVLEQNC